MAKMSSQSEATI